MKREWKPGDVALLTFWSGDERVCLRTGIPSNPGWASTNGASNTWTADSCQGGVRSIRPLVVIDPEDREQVERLSSAFDREYTAGRSIIRGGLSDAMQAALREFADPKPVGVYEHFTFETNCLPMRSVCGKVWTPADDTVAKAKCPTCVEMVEAGWTK